MRMVNSSTHDLDKILTLGKPAKNMKCLGYTHGGSSPKATFVPLKKTVQMSPKMGQTSSEDMRHQKTSLDLSSLWSSWSHSSVLLSSL